MDMSIIIFLLLSLLGAGLLVAGVFVLAGTGWALITGGALSLFAAAFLMRGIARG